MADIAMDEPALELAADEAVRLHDLPVPIGHRDLAHTLGNIHADEAGRVPRSSSSIHVGLLLSMMLTTHPI
jgi:hypothetical protein